MKKQLFKHLLQRPEFSERDRIRIAEHLPQEAAPKGKQRFATDLANDPVDKVGLHRRMALSTLVGGGLFALGAGTTAVIEKTVDLALSPSSEPLIFPQKAIEAFWKLDSAGAALKEIDISGDGFLRYTIESLNMALTGLEFDHDRTSRMRDIFHRTQGETKRVIGDILQTDYIRGGVFHEANEIYQAVRAEPHHSEAWSIYLGEKAFSLALANVDNLDVLKPEKWGFEEGLEQVYQFDPKGRGLKFDIQKIGETYAVSFDDNFKITKEMLNYGVKFFYLLFFVQLYAVACAPADTIKDHEKRQFRILKSYAQHAPYERAVWNAAYLTALHYHRRVKADQNAAVASLLRDHLLGICINAHPDFWPRVFKNRLARGTFIANDVTALALNLNVGTGEFLQQFKDKMLSGKDILALPREQIRPMAYRQAISMLRAKAGIRPTFSEITSNYIVRGRMLSSYIPTPEDIFNKFDI